MLNVLGKNKVGLLVSLHIKSNQGLLSSRWVKTFLETLVIGSLVSLPRVLVASKESGPFDENTAALLAIIVVYMFTIGPWIEEFIFRLIPQWLTNKIIVKSFSPERRTLPFWVVGILSSLVFGLVHTGIGAQPTQTSQFYIPTTFAENIIGFAGGFFIGIYLWALLRERGFFHVGVSHTLMNILALVYSAVAILIFSL